MVRKTTERLGADNILHALMDQFYHLTGQEPSFTGLVADIHNRLCIFHNPEDAGGGVKMLAGFERLHCGTS